MAAIIQLLHLLCLLSIIHPHIARKELRRKEFIHDNITQAKQPVHYNRINPSHVIQHSWRPRVFSYQGFLSNEECDHLLSLEKQDNSVGKGSDLRDVDTGKLTRSLEIVSVTDDVVAARIEDRIFAWTLLPKENSRPFQILHIGHEDAKKKYDYFGNKSILLSNELLMATVILYLSNISHGGQILFPESEADDSHRKSNIRSDCEETSHMIRPIKGNALLFFNTHLDASPDKSSSHARCPVPDGDLWYATKFFHVKKSFEKKISLQSEEIDCTDEDDDCARWAAIGECERNPVFMLGSPDYYGTCRKSCNSC